MVLDIFVNKFSTFDCILFESIGIFNQGIQQQEDQKTSACKMF